MTGPDDSVGDLSALRSALNASRLRAALTTTLLAALFASLGLITPLTLSAQDPRNSTNAAAISSLSAAKQNADGFMFRPPLATVGLRAGVNLARAGSQIFDFTTEQLTLEPGDFNSFTIGGDLALRVSDPIDIVFGFGYSSTTKSSEFREFVDQDNLPITQRTTFTQTPITAGMRVYLMPRGRRVGRFAWVPTRLAPYIGVGGGMVHYSFKQVGSFVDYQDNSVFDDALQSSDWTLMGMASAGLEFSIQPRVLLATDVRYQWASADLREDFIGFSDGIDLSGLQVSVGVHFRL